MITPSLLHKAVAQIEALDWELAEEIQNIRKSARYQEEADLLRPFIQPAVKEGFEEAMDSGFGLETIVLRVGRPVLTINANKPLLEFSDVESQFWKQKLEVVQDMLVSTIPSVGRIGLQHHPTYEWVGTGWLVAENIVVTNRHVAEVFGRRNRQGFVFRQLLDSPVTAAIDFLKEKDNPAAFEFQLIKILHIEDDGGPDIAFLEVKPASGTRLPSPIRLNAGMAMDNAEVAVIGYPARDSRIPEQDLMQRIFGDVYNVKRLAPGKITGTSSNRLYHDCTTLGGCSGAIVLDLHSGEAAGLHFAGRFLESNYAVPGSIVAKRLQAVQQLTLKLVSMHTPASTPQIPEKETALTTAIPAIDAQTFTFNIPLQITVSVGLPVASGAVTSSPQPATQKEEEDLDEFYTEGVAEDYDDREGYNPSFLGEAFEVPLPEVADERKQKDILYYERDGQQEAELRYEHFSVVMSKSRRLCFFSAVNINGAKSRKATRTGWRTDPRVPNQSQILKECYGNPPKFSRGHMTRREDPIWGNETAALRGNADSMCVTNAVPQMQSFNAPIWLGLEDYALQHAREDGMKISVFTGPVFHKNDPTIYDVKIPVKTWKVIVFIHDETGKACATGYVMSQKNHLPEEEFVFGAYKAAQTPIATIEKMTGLSFGYLSSQDPLADQEELPATSIESLDQIRFL